MAFKKRITLGKVKKLTNHYYLCLNMYRTMIFLLATLFIIVAYTNRTISTYRQNYTHDPSARMYSPPPDQHILASMSRSSKQKVMRSVTPT